MRVSSIQNELRSLSSLEAGQLPSKLGSKPEVGSGLLASPAGEKEAVDFGHLLSRALNEVNSLQVEADRQAELVATGEAENPHDAVIAMEKADLALQLTIKITEKALAAYQQISQMQI